ncbi:hypothetical protein M409DRAFT_54720 [Zasmidium cellare ATCC 36951]|uniref:Uncharacterized protein n=1 Tax=Zasmidium cellare ATCC 36951 TaxID=1080233 RepID=A0A6A6CLD2_ZASCE|nr:uncharacterized protein M409DRAFT_54720 [Zasmidium cellare ATCC 36951]KAF2166960.1 hypothetical protein M409DRAFT_54720 [Zasmidium cellare ATCC 36951]
MAERATVWGGCRWSVGGRVQCAKSHDGDWDDDDDDDDEVVGRRAWGAPGLSQSESGVRGACWRCRTLGKGRSKKGIPGGGQAIPEAAMCLASYAALEHPLSNACHDADTDVNADPGLAVAACHFESARLPRRPRAYEEGGGERTSLLPVEECAAGGVWSFNPSLAAHATLTPPRQKTCSRSALSTSTTAVLIAQSYAPHHGAAHGIGARGLVYKLSPGQALAKQQQQQQLHMHAIVATGRVHSAAPSPLSTPSRYNITFTRPQSTLPSSPTPAGRCWHYSWGGLKASSNHSARVPRIDDTPPVAPTPEQGKRGNTAGRHLQASDHGRCCSRTCSSTKLLLSCARAHTLSAKFARQTRNLRAGTLLEIDFHHPSRQFGSTMPIEGLPVSDLFKSVKTKPLPRFAASSKRKCLSRVSYLSRGAAKRHFITAPSPCL